MDKKNFVKIIEKLLKEGDLSRVEEILMEEEMSKQEKIEIIKHLIEKGEYKIPTEELVNKMLKRFELESDS